MQSIKKDWANWIISFHFLFHYKNSEASSSSGSNSVLAIDKAACFVFWKIHLLIQLVQLIGLKININN